MVSPKRSGCLICSAEIEYSRDPVERKCNYCGNDFVSNAVCTNGHFICDDCQSSPAIDFLPNKCVQEIEDPIELAALSMKNPQIKMHCPEHHSFVPVVLYTAYQNQLDNGDDKIKKQELFRSGAELVRNGFYGTHGSCGAAIGAGIFCSVITGATPLSTEPWKLGNKITAHCLFSIAEHGGPRCRKRDTFLSILNSAEFLKEEMNINLRVKRLCEYSFSRKKLIPNPFSWEAMLST